MGGSVGYIEVVPNVRRYRQSDRYKYSATTGGDRGRDRIGIMSYEGVIG